MLRLGEKIDEKGMVLWVVLRNRRAGEKNL